MKLIEAISIIGVTSSSPEELKVCYRIACKKYHPDVNEFGIEMMKLINSAYDLLTSADYSYLFTNGNINHDECLSDAIIGAYNKIKNLYGITIELCGVWLWVSGTTKSHKNYLKENGFKWSGKKKMWSWHKGKGYKRGKNTWDMSKIRTSYGSTSLQTETATALQ